MRLDHPALQDLPRAVITGAFELLDSLRRRGPARVVDLQRDCGLPRTTVRRLLDQLQEVGAVTRSEGNWRLGPTVMGLGAVPPAHPGLRSIARRPLMELAVNTGALVALSVEMVGKGMVIEVLPGTRRLAVEPETGMLLGESELSNAGLVPDHVAVAQAFRRASTGDLRPVVDAGAVHPDISCAAVPLRVTPTDVGVVWLMLPGGTGIPAPLVMAARRTADRIGSRLTKSR